MWDSHGRSLWDFLRVSTNARVWPKPPPVNLLFAFVNGTLALPNVVTVETGLRHTDILELLIVNYKAVGSLVSDAVLAALAIENGATLASTDREFGRFDELKWLNPLSN